MTEVWIDHWFRDYFLCIDCLEQPVRPVRSIGVDQRSTFALGSVKSELFGHQVSGLGTDFQRDWSFIGGSRVIIRPQLTISVNRRKTSAIQASCKYFY